MEDALTLAALDIEATAQQPRIQDAAQQLADNYERVADRLPGAQNSDIRALRDHAIEWLAATGLPQ